MIRWVGMAVLLFSVPAFAAPGDDIVVLDGGSDRLFVVSKDESRAPAVHFGTRKRMVAVPAYREGDTLSLRTATLPGTLQHTESGWRLRCDGDSRALKELSQAEKTAFLKRTKFLPAPKERLPVVLARDKRGTHYYVDRLAGDVIDYRLWMGRRGAMRKVRLSDVVDDPAGKVWVGSKGSLHATGTKDERTVSFRDHRGETTPLLDLKVDNDVVFGDLGVYSTPTSPCHAFKAEEMRRVYQGFARFFDKRRMRFFEARHGRYLGLDTQVMRPTLFVGNDRVFRPLSVVVMGDDRFGYKLIDGRTRTRSRLQASLKGRWRLQCADRTWHVKELTGPPAERLRNARFQPRPFVRTPVLLARDNLGVYYYVDRYATPKANKRRLFRGRKGLLKEIPLRESLRDGQGDWVLTKARDALHWRADQVELVDKRGVITSLTAIPLSKSQRFIHEELGVYPPVASPCDAL